MSKICPHCNRNVRHHHGIIGTCGDVQKLRTVMGKVVSRMVSNGFHQHGPCRANFYHPDLMDLQSALTNSPPPAQRGRPPQEPTEDQQRLVSSHYAQWKTTRSRDLAAQAGISNNKAWRWLQKMEESQ